MENNDVTGVIYHEHRRIRAIRGNISKVVDKHITQLIAASQLSITERQIKRLVKRYREDGV